MNQTAGGCPEFLIVGSGAGGSAAAWQLVTAGRRVLLLERGAELPEDGSTLDPAQVLGGRFNAKERWIDVCAGRDFAPEEHFNPGGKTRWYGAALLRPDAHEFEAEPACGLLGWPLRGEELAPFYSRVEQLLDVRCFEEGPDLQRMQSTFQRDGWESRPLPLGLAEAITEHPFEETHYDGFAVPGGLKADARHRLLDPLRHQPHFRFEMGAQVETLLPDPADARRIVGVRCSDGREFRAPTILLAAGAMHSPRLLQRYLADTGLDRQLPAAALVGRYFKRHLLTAVIGLGLRKKVDRVSKTSVFLHRQFPHSSVQPLGGWIDHDIVCAQLRRVLPDRICEWLARRAYGFFLQTEDASHPDNRVSAAANAPPALDYDPRRMPALVAEHAGLVAAFRRSLRRAGYLGFTQAIGLQGTAHAVGTLVAGRDPLNSVVDATGAVHGLYNLHVVDGSVLPRLGRMNPALSIYAWSLRVATLLSQAPPA